MFISFQHFSYLFQFVSYQVTMAPINPWIYRCKSTKNRPKTVAAEPCRAKDQMDLENNGEMVLLEKLANQIKGHGNWFGYGDSWRFLEPLSTQKRDKVEKHQHIMTYDDIL